MVSNRRKRRESIREAMLRAMVKLGDTKRFSTHELHSAVLSLSPIELAGLGPVRAMLRSIERIDTFGIFIRGHPSIIPHEDGTVNISQFGEGRTRSKLWYLKVD